MKTKTRRTLLRPQRRPTPATPKDMVVIALVWALVFAVGLAVWAAAVYVAIKAGA